jgi:hypothetical protein
MIYFSKSTNGFYHKHIHGKNIPADCVEITEAQHKELLEGQAQGLAIVADHDGRPVNRERVLSPEQKAAAIKTQAKAALQESDVIVLRAYEAQEPVAKEWVEYRAKLREVLAGNCSELPNIPTV